MGSQSLSLWPRALALPGIASSMSIAELALGPLRLMCVNQWADCRQHKFRRLSELKAYVTRCLGSLAGSHIFH